MGLREPSAEFPVGGFLLFDHAPGTLIPEAAGLSVSPHHEPEHLRVLVANQRPARLDHVTTIVVSLGHEVIARSIEVTEVAAVTSRERPDVALVGLGDSSDHALEMIGEIVDGAMGRYR